MIGLTIRPVICRTHHINGLIGGEKQDCGPWRWCQLRRASTCSIKQRTLSGGPVPLSVASGLNYLWAASEGIAPCCQGHQHDGSSEQRHKQRQLATPYGRPDR